MRTRNADAQPLVAQLVSKLTEVDTDLTGSQNTAPMEQSAELAGSTAVAELEPTKVDKPIKFNGEWVGQQLLMQWNSWC